MTYFIQLIFVIINITMAQYHARLIKQNKHISHGLWGTLYFLLAGVSGYLLHDSVMIAIAAVMRKPVFDISLNRFRHKPIFYVSKSTGSLIDKMLYKVPVALVHLLCLAAWIVLNFYVK